MQTLLTQLTAARWHLDGIASEPRDQALLKLRKARETCNAIEQQLTRIVLSDDLYQQVHIAVDELKARLRAVEEEAR